MTVDIEQQRMDDDGCPNVIDPVPESSATPKIDRFSVPVRYHVFVPFSPAIVRVMIGTQFAVDIEPATYNGRSGSYVSSMCKKDTLAVRDRFYPPSPQHEESSNGESQK